MSSRENHLAKPMRMSLVLMVCAGLSSCMHIGMMGGAGDNHTVDDSTIEKEITAGHVRVNAILPPVKTGTPAVLTVRLSLDSSGQALSGAKIDLLVIGHNHDPEFSEGGEHIQLNKTREAGTYTATYEASHAGQYTFAFSITETESEIIDPPIVVEVTRIVSEGQHEHNGEVNGGGGMNTYVIVGAAAMIAVMVAMMIGRS